jgi:hypothetical protein
LGAVSLYHGALRQGVTDAPKVKVDTDKPNGGTSVDAPFAHVETGKNGTQVETPGVKVEVPKSPGN